MPYTTVVAGTVITASWGNMVRDQLVTPFADAATRNAQITAPVEGMYADLADEDMITRYTGTAWEPGITGFILANGWRDTSTGTTTTEVGVLRIDDIPILIGRAYRIETGALHAQCSVLDDFAGFQIRYTTDGSTPTTGSAVLPGSKISDTHSNIFTIFNVGTILTVYRPTANETLSLLLTVLRVAGSGNVQSFGSTDQRVQLMITDVGKAKANVGTAI